jgi:uncharacterized membrane protein YhiD involved in acid resistance
MKDKINTHLFISITTTIIILILFIVFKNLNNKIIIKDTTIEQYTICRNNNKFDVSYNIKTNEVISIILDKDNQNNVCTNKSIERFLNLN